MDYTLFLNLIIVHKGGQPMIESYNKLIKISVWSTVFLFVIRCIISWGSIIADFSIYDIWGYAGEAIGIAIILTALYEKYIWRVNPFENTPKLSPRYIGKLKSTYDNKVRPATLEIKQTLTSIHVTMITQESKSKSLSTSIDNILGETQLTYCYLNTPKNEFRSRSDIHYGTAILSINNPNKIEGQYYTDRKTTGDMIFIPDNNHK